MPYKIPAFIVAAISAVSFPQTSFAADLNEAPVFEAVPAGNDYYLAIRLGLSSLDDTTFALNSAAAVPTDINNIYDDRDLAGAVALGFNLGGGFRGEIEYSAAKHGIEAHTIVALPATLSGASAFGDTTTKTGLLNAYYDADFGGFKPFIGAGIGYSQVDFDNHGVVIPAGGVAGLPGGPVTALNDSGNGLTWQVSAGTSFAVADNTDFEVSYRYQSIEDVELTAVDGTNSEVDLSSQSVFAGFRFNF